LDTFFTSELAEPSKHRWKVLIIGAPGSGKTTWAATAIDPAIAACETGVGSGLLTLAHNPGVMAVVPASFVDLRSVAYDTFLPFQKKQTRVLDSLTAMTKSFVKDHVLTAFSPRNQKEAARRQAGILTGFDYSDVADTVRTLLTKFLSIDAHIVVTALPKTEKDDAGNIISILPDLPGALAMGAPAMFDSVLHLKTRKVIRDPKDPRSAKIERYFITGADNIHVAKDRNSVNGRSFLNQEEIFDPETGQGTFTDLYSKILNGHKAAQSKGASQSKQ
jgi:hypothetical protein